MSPQAWTPNGNLILFDLNWRVIPAPHEIWITSSQTGGEAAVVTADGADVIDAAQSQESGGDFVVYTSNQSGGRQLWLYRHSDKTVQQISTGSGERYDPVFNSGNHLQIAFVSTESGNAEIVVGDLVTGITTQITQSTQPEANPYWVHP